MSEVLRWLFVTGEGWDWLAVFLAMLVGALAVLWVLVWWLPTRRMESCQARDEYMHLLGFLFVIGVFVLGAWSSNSQGAT